MKVSSNVSVSPLHSSFVNRAHEILAGIEHQRAAVGIEEAIRLTREQWIDDEHDGTLKLLAEVILGARQQALIQNMLNADREQLHHGHLTHDQLVEVGHHYEMLRHAACEYNHLLRGFIESHREDIDRDELTGWLAMASQGKNDWAEGEVTGATSEVSLHAALMGLAELKGLRYATLEEDLHGNDFVAGWQGKMVTIDAKTGRYFPLSEHKHGQLHLEISVPRDVVKGFRLTRHGLDLLRNDVRRALHESAGTVVHPSHQFASIDIA